MKRLALIPAVVLALSGASADALRLPSAPRCPIFPAGNAWNERVDSLPVAANSAQLIASIGSGVGLHPDFGSGLYDGQPIGIPFDIVTRKTPRSSVSFDYADESDHVRYPIPRTVHIEGGRASSGDRHALLIDKDACRLYELYALYPSGKGWKAGSGATWNLRSNAVRPAGWTSADAAGLPIFPAIVRYDEVARGAVRHAMRVTVRRTRREYVYPARHFASALTDPNLPRMGERLRLRKDFDTSQFPPHARAILDGLKRYGVFVADNGGNWLVSIAPDRRFQGLESLARVKGSDFEVITPTGPDEGPRIRR